MSCGCGGGRNIPLSVALRQRALELAIGCADSATLAAEEFYAFLLCGVREDGGSTALADVRPWSRAEIRKAESALDAPPKVPSPAGRDPNAVFWRNAALLAPVSAFLVELREPVVHDLETLGIQSIGQLIQMSWGNLRANDDRYRRVSDALHARGLKIGMTQPEIVHWIQHGGPNVSQSDPQEA